MSEFKLQLHGFHKFSDAISNTKDIGDGGVVYDQYRKEFFFKVAGLWYNIDRNAPNAAEQELYEVLDNLAVGIAKDGEILNDIKEITVHYNLVTISGNPKECNILGWTRGEWELKPEPKEPIATLDDYLKNKSYGEF